MTDSTRYFIPAQAVEVTTEIKRSRFIAHITHCRSADEGFDIIEQVKKHYPDARHHCWAFIACPHLGTHLQLLQKIIPIEEKTLE